MKIQEGFLIVLDPLKLSITDMTSWGLSFVVRFEKRRFKTSIFEKLGAFCVSEK